MPHNTPELRWIRPPQQARSQKTLGRILDAAEALVAEKGFDDTSVAEVVERAGSSVGAFYSRFPDKDALLYSLWERHYEQALATADDALDPERWRHHSIRELMGGVVRFLVSIYRERAGLMRVFVLRGQQDLEFRSRQERLVQYVDVKLSTLLLERISEIRHPRPRRAIAFGFLMIHNTLESTLLFGELHSTALSFDDRELSEEATRAFLAYLDLQTPTDSRLRGSAKEQR